MANTNFNPENFSRIPCAVSFDGVNLGGTDGAVTVRPILETDDTTCNQAKGRVVRRWIRELGWEIQARFKEPSSVLSKVFGMNPSAFESLIGSDLFAQAKPLILTGITHAGEAAIGPWTVQAVATVNQFDWDGEKDSVLDVTFRTVPGSASPAS